MIFKQLNPASCWTFLLAEGNEAVLIDPVINHVSDYLDLLKDEDLKLTYVIDTHTHADHISAGPSLKDATDCEYIMHHKSPPECVTHRVTNGDEIEFAGKPMKFIETPGHTKDSISILYDDKFFTGDFLFLEDAGAGRDDLPGGDAEAHYESLQLLNDMPGNIMIYPSHEYRQRKPSNLDKQREKNPHLQYHTKEAFVNYITELKLGPAEWMKDVLKANYRCSRDPNSAWIPTDVPACEVKGTMNPNAGDVDVHYICKDKTNAAKEDGALLLDVREPSELVSELGAIEGVMNIPIGKLSNSLDQLEDYKDKPIVVVCRSGARATTGAQILTTAGFKDISVLEGGMLAYRM